MSYLGYAVDTVVFNVDHTNAFTKGNITEASRTQSSGFRMAAPAGGDEPSFAIILQRLADGLDCETIPVVIDEPDHFLSFGVEF